MPGCLRASSRHRAHEKRRLRRPIRRRVAVLKRPLPIRIPHENTLRLPAAVPRLIEPEPHRGLGLDRPLEPQRVRSVPGAPTDRRVILLPELGPPLGEPGHPPLELLRQGRRRIGRLEEIAGERRDTVRRRRADDGDRIGGERLRGLDRELDPVLAEAAGGQRSAHRDLDRAPRLHVALLDGDQLPIHVEGTAEGARPVPGHDGPRNDRVPGRDHGSMEGPLQHRGSHEHVGGDRGQNARLVRGHRGRVRPEHRVHDDRGRGLVGAVEGQPDAQHPLGNRARDVPGKEDGRHQAHRAVPAQEGPGRHRVLVDRRHREIEADPRVGDVGRGEELHPRRCGVTSGVMERLMFPA